MQQGMQQLLSGHRLHIQTLPMGPASGSRDQNPLLPSCLCLLQAGLAPATPAVHPSPCLHPPKTGYKSDTGGLGSSRCSRAGTFSSEIFQNPIGVQEPFFNCKTSTYFYIKIYMCPVITVLGSRQWGTVHSGFLNIGDMFILFRSWPQ